jgi:hypothetical protein
MEILNQCVAYLTGGTRTIHEQGDPVAAQECMDANYPIKSDPAPRSDKEGGRTVEGNERELKNARAALRTMDDELKGLRDEMERIKQKNSAMRKERQQLESNIAEVERQQRFHNDQMARQVHDLQSKLEYVQTQYHQNLHLLRGKTSDLEGLKGFLTTNDVYSDTDVIAMVERLNSEILQASAFMADSFAEYMGTQSDARLGDDAGARASVVKGLGEKMVHLLQTTAHVEDPTLIQIALQATMVNRAEEALSSWLLENPQIGQFLAAVFQRIRQRGKRIIVN